MKWNKQVNAVLLAVFAVFSVLPGTPDVRAQELVRGIETRHVRLFSGDSVKMEVAYAERERAAFIVLLPDRYGIQISTRQLMRAFADAGYHIAAIHLLTVVPEGDRDTALVIHEDDPARIIEAMVEIRNDERGLDMAGLLAFDVGATAGLLAESRIPLFKGCALFYPSQRDVFLDALQKCKIPVEVNLGREDETFPEQDMLDLKVRFMSKTNPIVFRYYDAGRYFFNPGHPDFNEQAMQRGIEKSAVFLSRYFR